MSLLWNLGGCLYWMSNPKPSNPVGDCQNHRISECLNMRVGLRDAGDIMIYRLNSVTEG